MKQKIFRLWVLCLISMLLTGCGGEKKTSEPLTVQRENTSYLHSTEQSVNVSGKIYYVSPAGNDENDGLSSEHPLKTVARAAALELFPGDAILFQCGGIYDDACLELKNGGMPDNHILISWYGTGEYPILRGGVNQDKQYLLAEDRSAIVAVKLSSVANVTVRGLHIDRANFGIFLNNALYNDLTDGELVVEDCVFTNIGGYHCLARTEAAPAIPPFYSNAIEIGLRSQQPLALFSITNSVFLDCEAAMHIDTNKKTVIQNVRVENMLREGILFESSKADEDDPSRVENVVLQNIGTVLGKDWGTAAIQWNVCSNFICDHLDISYTGNGAYRNDMVGGDYEATNKNIIIQNSRIHNNGGPGWLIFSTPGWGKDNQNISLVGNVFANNGLQDEYTAAVLKHEYNEDAGGRICDNQIWLAYEGQYLNCIDGENTNAWPKSYDTSNNQVMGVYQAETETLPDNCLCSIDFDDAYNYDAWYAYSNVRHSYMNGMYLTTVLGVEDPSAEISVVSRKKLGLDLTGAKKLQLRLKNKSEAVKMKLYFAGEDGKFTQECITLPIETMNDGFVTYTLDISNYLPALGKVQRIKIVPAEGVAEGWMQYDYIRFFK